jgi:lipopolysaccharide transport system ATP-binding protein
MEPSVQLTALSKVFPAGGMSGKDLFQATGQKTDVGDKIAVDAVSLTLRSGDRIGIVGRNGAGKSTLLQMMAGLSSPTSGTISIVGKVTAVMTLGVGLREELTGRENIYVDGEIQGRRRQEIDSVIDEVIAFADLGEFIEYPVRTYSTGMKARLAFSMISHIEPEILIIDEALSVGDANFSAKATARIKQICARGKIVIIVSHSMQSVRDICNRCLWMENGRVIRDGAPDEVTSAYIDAVRSADEAQLEARFRRLVGTRSFMPGWAIERAEAFQPGTDEPRSLLHAGMAVRFALSAITPKRDSPARLRVRITRLDGLLVFDQSFDANQYRLDDGRIGLEIGMQHLSLGAAVYRMDVSLEAGQVPGAERSSMLEVFAPDPPSGGKPMLLYPVSAISVPCSSVPGNP